MQANVVKLIQTIQAAVEKDDKARIVEALKEMKAQALSGMTVEILQATKAGVVIAGLKKNADIRISVLAKELVDAWKGLVKATASTSSEPIPAPGGAPSPLIHTPVAEPPEFAKRPASEQLSLRLGYAMPPPGDLQTLVGWPYPDGLPLKCDKNRVRVLRKGGGAKDATTGPVVLWMMRDQRVCDNWALIRAQELALARIAPLLVVFNLTPSYLGATARAYGFMLRGLRCVERDLHGLGVPFLITLGSPVEQVPALVGALGASALVTDFSPLRMGREWRAGVAAALPPGCTMEEVDAHNVVPCWLASPKLEVGARTIRKKLHALIPTYASAYPRLPPHPHALGAGTLAGLHTAGGGGGGGGSSSSSSSSSALSLAPLGGDGFISFPSLLSSLQVDMSVGEVDWAQPGERAGRDVLSRFLPARLGKYDELRNDPCYPAAQSNLSPYLHFGQLSPHRVLLELRRATGTGWGGLFPDERKTAAASFAEELVVRREVADNFCHYQPSYDSLEGASGWAQETLADHAGDKRTATYTHAQFDAGRTHEALWNAAQMELVHRGKLHGFMRMYWAKKILEWSATPAQALATAIALNDRYSLDGRDPNGYVGCMWAIAGVHDMGWAERAVFGKIRYMNLEGCKRKFDVARYIAMWPVRALPGAAGGGGGAKGSS